MDFELWWLLPIPALFFAMGWIAARIDIKHLLRESRALPLSYFRGLNFLLNEQPDKAIESFIEVVKVDPQTIDLHFALGNLFRRQGEIDRAIRMHQNLLDRPDLPADKRQTAVFELAQDFHRAGLLDRAGRAFPDSTAARSRFRRWDSCCRSTSRRRTGRKRSRPPSAWRRWPSGRTSRKSRTTIASWRRTRCCVRSSTTRGSSSTRRWPNTSSARARRCCSAMSSHSAAIIVAAIAAWQRIESQNPAFLGLVADRLADAYRKIGDVAQGIRVLRNYEDQYPSLDSLTALFNQILAHEGAESATQLIKDELARNPTLLGLDKLLEAQLMAAPADRRHDLELVKGLVGQHIKRLGMYRCENCGFRAKQYYWRCPGCGKWETYSPRRTEIAGRFCVRNQRLP